MHARRSAARSGTGRQGLRGSVGRGRVPPLDCTAQGRIQDVGFPRPHTHPLYTHAATPTHLGSHTDYTPGTAGMGMAKPSQTCRTPERATSWHPHMGGALSPYTSQHAMDRHGRRASRLHTTRLFSMDSATRALVAHTSHMRTPPPPARQATHSHTHTRRTHAYPPPTHRTVRGRLKPLPDLT